MRPGWRDYFLDIAYVVATRATCDRAHVGAVIVRDNRILATGYNGSPPGWAHCTDEGHLIEYDADGVDHCVRTVHAEANAIAHAARAGVSLQDSEAYLTLAPCDRCRMLLWSAGIKHWYTREQHGSGTVIVSAPS